MLEINSPLFVLTSDVDWASEACIADLAQEAAALGIRPVFMATGESRVLDGLAADGRAEIGWHPNFLPGSDHGADVDTVVARMAALFPGATTFRSHSFVDSSPITAAMRARGLTYDSNLCLHLQPNLMPLRHQSGLVRFPVFWEDDVHYTQSDVCWDVERMLPHFLTPGLKILNVHPVNFALNVPDAAGYRSIKSLTKTLDADGLVRHRFSVPGTRTFVLALLKRLREAGHRFYTLAELYGMTAKSLFLDGTGDVSGRSGVVSDAEFHAYRSGDAQHRQSQLREVYNARNALDRYATSRDYNMRELEIEAIGAHLPDGDILDLGCGNGYTLISLARTHRGSRMVGIDFADSLIAGAKLLAAEETPDNPPSFVCADAIAYVAAQPSGSLDAVITERFLLNMPDVATQHRVIADIHRVLKPGGRFLMCEGSAKGFRALNTLRAGVGLDEIADVSVDNHSAIRFEDDDIEAFLAETGFTLTDKLGLGSYFVISRVLHPLLVAPQAPRFSARINDLARRVQSGLPFSPDIGSNVIWVLEKGR